MPTTDATDTADGIVCDECHTTVRVERTRTDKLKATCACSGRPVKVASRLPEGWFDE